MPLVPFGFATSRDMGASDGASVDRDDGVMPLAFTDHLERDAATLVGVLASADLDAAVPSCPGWSLRDLGEHVAEVHRWASEQASGIPQPRAGDGELISRLRGGADRLVTVLRDRPPSTPCWAIYPPETVGTWARRQAHETSIHVWDAMTAVGREYRMPIDLAADGVAEVVMDLYPRQVRLDRLEPIQETIEFDLTDAETVTLTGVSGGPSAAIVRGPAEKVLLMLWGRRNLDGTGPVEVRGDVAAVQRVLRGVLTP
jgi:uncharacterized protein (TIGR03083 family)